MSDVLANFERLRERFDGAIMEEVARICTDAGLGDSTLQGMLDYHFSTGGKRLRAILPLMVAEAMEVEPEKLVPFGAACELIHNATLVHDDLQDGDEVRRGAPSVWAKFGAPQAVNLGDAMLYLAPLCLDRLEIGAEQRWRAAQRMFRDILQVIDGQEREFQLCFEQVERADYERMVVGKTSGLFALPIAGAAELCGADGELLQALEQAARHLGVIFQIQDDILDLYAEKGRESRGADIAEGKISMLVVAFKELAPPEECARLQAILGVERDKTEESDVRWAIEAIRERGALQSALEAIEKREREVLSIEGLEAHPELGGLMAGLIDVFLRPIAALTGR